MALAINWVAHVYRLRKERQLIIAALDAPVKAALLADGLPTLSLYDGDTNNFRGDGAIFRHLGANKAMLISQILQAGRHVLVSDVRRAAPATTTSTERRQVARESIVPPFTRAPIALSQVDVAWMGDPERWILSALEATDVMSATDCLSPTADESGVVRSDGVNRCAYRPGNSKGHAAFNTGIMFFRATLAARVVAAAWLVRLTSPSVDAAPRARSSV